MESTVSDLQELSAKQGAVWEKQQNGDYKLASFSSKHKSDASSSKYTGEYMSRVQEELKAIFPRKQEFTSGDLKRSYADTKGEDAAHLISYLLRYHHAEIVPGKKRGKAKLYILT